MTVALWIALTCSGIRTAEITLAEREAGIIVHLERGDGDRFLRQAWREELADIRDQLDVIDEAKKAKGCPR